MMWSDPLPLTCWRVCTYGRDGRQCTHHDRPAGRGAPFVTVEQARAPGAFCGPEAHRMEFPEHATEQAPAPRAAHG